MLIKNPSKRWGSNELTEISDNLQELTNNEEINFYVNTT
jgi:hypothetical protein